MKFNDFEEKLQQDLHQYLLSMNEVDNHMPECPDVEERWEQIAQTYLPDGIREFNDYPTASLGWMMYIGMAVAKYWDAELLTADANNRALTDDIYAYMRDKRGYDHMDEYIREEVLLLKGKEYTALEKLTGECASRVYNILRHQNIEPGSKEAFRTYCEGKANEWLKSKEGNYSRCNAEKRKIIANKWRKARNLSEGKYDYYFTMESKEDIFRKEVDSLAKNLGIKNYTLEIL